MAAVLNQLKETIQTIPDFPKEGILFRDLTPVLTKPELCAAIIEELASRWTEADLDGVAGIESRGFLFGMSLAGKLGVPFVPLRKVGKLPGETFQTEYQLEYGSAVLEMQKNGVARGQHILIHDDLLATGGTAVAASDLISQAGGKVAGFSFLMELDYFAGREDLEEIAQVDSLISY